MNNFYFGFFLGMSLIVLIGYVMPLRIIPVQNELVKQGHGYYDSRTKEFKLRECR